MRVTKAFLFGVLFFGSSQARTLDAIQQSGTLKIATATYGSMVTNTNDELSGFEIELARAVAAKMNLKPEFVIRPFTVILSELNNKPEEFDLAIASHMVTSTRLKDNDFAKPHYCTGGVILTRKGGPLTTLELKDRVVGVTMGTLQYNFLRKLPTSMHIDIKQFANSDLTLQAVVNPTSGSSVDASVVDLIAATLAAKSNPDRLTISKLLWKGQVSMAIAKNNNSVKKALNTALDAVMTDGTYATLSQKYFGRDIRCSN